jgi:hypothetical protein
MNMVVFFVVGRSDHDNLLRIFIAHAVTEPHNDRGTDLRIMVINVFSLLDIHNAQYHETTSVQTSAMAFAIMHSDMVMFFQLHTQPLSSISSVCIGYVSCPLSKITYFCAISI